MRPARIRWNFACKLMDNHPKNTAVLKAVAERAGWGTPAPEGVFRGLASVHGLRKPSRGLRRGVG